MGERAEPEVPGHDLTYQARAEEVTADGIRDAVLAAVPLPQIDLGRADAA